MTSPEASINVHDHGIALDEKKIRVKCNYCDKVVSGFFRLKCHLGGVGKDVVSCEKVPENVKQSFRNILLENKRGSLAREVGQLNHPNLPLKRNLSPNSNAAKQIKCEASQTTSCGREEHANINSVVQDVVSERFPAHSRGMCSNVTVNAEAKEDPLLRQFQKCIGKFFYETGTDFSAVNSLNFQKMHNALLGGSQEERHKFPTLHDLKGWILQDEVKEMQEYVKNIRLSWTNTGCSVLLDGWVDEKGRNLVSFVVDCPEGPIYLHSTDVSAIVNDLEALQLLLDGVIKEVGVDNVVQIVACSTTGWLGAVGKHFMERCRKVFWTVSASHCIELMLGKIATMDSVKGILEQAKMITKFIYGHADILNLTRNYTDCYDLVKSSKMKLVVPFLTLENIILEKNNLRDMFTSSEWISSVWASSLEGKRVVNLVGDHSFWLGAEMTLKATGPLLRALGLINKADKPLLGYIYETMDQVKETIKKEFRNKKSQYDPFWKVIDEIWDTYLHSPLHAAGYYLNPSFFYSTDFYSDPEVASGLLSCIVHMVQDQHTQDLLSLQLDEYRHGRGAFEEGSSIDKITNVPPAQWWYTYGNQCPELQRVAIRILSQTCDGALKYGLKRGLAEKLLVNGRNCIEQQKLSDLAFVHYNLHLQNIQLILEDLEAEEIDPMDDWIVDKIQEISPRERTVPDFPEATINMEGPSSIEAHEGSSQQTRPI